MAFSLWQRNTIKFLISLGSIYAIFTLYMFLTTGEIDAIYKSLFIMIASLIFPFIAIVQSIYSAAAVAIFITAVIVIGKKVPEKYMMIFMPVSLLLWIIYGYIAMMRITGGA